MATYRRALSDAFESGADTQSAVNDVVTGYNLTSYAKDALKNYVPKLRRTYDASEIRDDHPVRFTNRGFRIDHSEDRTHKFCWRVPQAGRGNAFWIPLRINPAQESLWLDLLDGDVTVGEFRLQEYRTNWVLHVTVEYTVEEPQTPEEPTYVGFDLGESKLLTGCALQHDTPTQPLHVQDVPRLRARRTAWVASRVPVYEPGVLGFGVPSGHQRGGEHRRSRQPVGRERSLETGTR